MYLHGFWSVFGSISHKHMKINELTKFRSICIMQINPKQVTYIEIFIPIHLSRITFVPPLKTAPMKNRYVDLIEQTFDFPQEEFYVEEDQLHWHDIPLMELIKQYGTPLKVTYLPKISENIQRAKRMFNVAMAKVDYQG